MSRKRGEGTDRGVLHEVNFVKNLLRIVNMPKLQVDVASNNMIELHEVVRVEALPQTEVSVNKTVETLNLGIIRKIHSSQNTNTQNLNDRTSCRCLSFRQPGIQGCAPFWLLDRGKHRRRGREAKEKQQ